MMNRLRSRIGQFLNDIPMHIKMLCVYFLLVAVPLVGFTGFAFVRVNRVVQDQTFAAAQKISEDIYTNLLSTFSQTEATMDILAHNQLVYRMISANPLEYPLVDQLKDTQQLEETFSHLQKASGASRIAVYTGSEYLYSHQNQDIFSLEDVSQTPWMQTLLLSQSPARWFVPSELGEPDCHVFSNMRILYNTVHLEHPQAVLRVDVDMERIAEYMEAEPVTENGVLLLLYHGNVVLSSGSAHTDSDVMAAQLQAVQPNHWEDVSVNDVPCYLHHRPLAMEGWELATLIPKSDLRQVSRSLSLDLVKIAVILLGIAYGIAYLVSRSALKRLSCLSDAMQAVENGDTSVQLIPQGKDEIGQLTHSFAVMMQQINTFMDEKEAYGREIKNLELKALQAQINPHFLYNTLDLVNCTALLHNVPEISRVVTSLAKFYKISLSKGREVITLREELRHARIYLDIQNMRFENRVKVQWQADPDILDCQTIKIILQPLIENAIIHGIFEKEEPTGCLSLRAYGQDGDVVIEIEDDGVGMDEQTRVRNFTYQPGMPGLTPGGYGVCNINERLHLAYGDGYGLSCESTLGKGTRITVRIPAQKEGHEMEASL